MHKISKLSYEKFTNSIKIGSLNMDEPSFLLLIIVITIFSLT